jgi:hypothetical protein
MVIKNIVPQTCTTVQLKAYDKETYAVQLATTEAGCLILCGEEWTTYIDRLEGEQIRWLCISWKKQNKFYVDAFNHEGLEIRKDAAGTKYVNNCLVQATYETYTEQVTIHQSFK